MQQLNLSINPWFALDPIACYWTWNAGESNQLRNYILSQPRGSVVISTLSYTEAWVNSVVGQAKYMWKSQAAFQQALEAYINSTWGLPHYTPMTPAVGIDAQQSFMCTPYHDAYFSGAAATLNPNILRLFVATPLYIGPGEYRILCADREVVNVVVDKKPTNDVFFLINNKASGMSLSVSGNVATAGAALVQQPKNSSGAAYWRVEPLSGGTFLIANYASVFTVNVASSNSADNAPLVQWPWGGGQPNEVFQFTPVGNNFYKIISKLNGKLLSVQGGSTTAGAALVLLSDASADSQLWSLSPI